ncbi:MAG TPA: hypothetical protein GX518_01425 [Firmicutes bacterium]|nr:hypothetical protein [Bacillota bacterium]
MLELRAYAYLDSLQPQFAALTAALVQGNFPRANDAALYLEVAPGIEVYRLIDIALKASRVELGYQMVERQFGMLEFHSPSQSDVLTAGEAILAALGKRPEDALPPNLIAATIVRRVDPHQAQILNRSKAGSLLLPGSTLCVIEVEPAAYAVLAANEAEKVAAINLIDTWTFGVYGRVFFSGTEAEVKVAAARIKDLFGWKGSLGD